MNDNKFTFYHPNGKCTGAAIRFAVSPATEDRDGAVLFTIARQNALADHATATPAGFDWLGGTTVKLSPLEAAEILMVFGGQLPSLIHAGKDGLFHNTPQATTSVQLKRSEDYTRPGFLLGVGRTPKADPTARTYRTFAFSPAEAFLVQNALRTKLGAICFGE